MPTIDICATGKNIKQIMTCAGKTVKDVQHACGLTTGNAVYKWIHGSALPSIDNLVVLAEMFGVRLDDIIVTKS